MDRITRAMQSREPSRLIQQESRGHFKVRFLIGIRASVHSIVAAHLRVYAPAISPDSCAVRSACSYSGIGSNPSLGERDRGRA
jgi:hypothetical protein